MNATTFTPEGLLREAERGPRDPYTRARSYRMRQPLDGILASPGPSAGTTDAPDYAEPPYPHSLRDEGIGDERHPAAVPPNIHSDRTPSQCSGKGRKGKQTDEAIPGRKRTLEGKPCDPSHSTKAVSFLTNMQEPVLKRSRCSFRRLPPSSAVPPVLLRFRKRGTGSLPGKTTGGKWHLSNLGASS